jgi:hypothetical protein
MAIPCRRLFAGTPMPDLQVPRTAEPVPTTGRLLAVVGANGVSLGGRSIEI